MLASGSPRRSELLKTLARARLRGVPFAHFSARVRRAVAPCAQGLRFEVLVSTFEETLDKRAFASAAGALARFVAAQRCRTCAVIHAHGRAADYAKETALHKAIEVAQRHTPDGQLADLIISADTVVEAADGTILEKPDGAAGAEAMLAQLSGTRHAVHTGVALILPRAVGAPPCVLHAAAVSLPPPPSRPHANARTLTTRAAPSLRRPGAGRVAAGAQLR